MRLKAVTTALVIVGLFFTVGFPFILGPKPDGSQKEVAEYALKFGTYWILVMLIWVAVIICAWIVLRQTVKNIKSDREVLMKSFVEGTLKDHEERQKEQEKMKELIEEAKREPEPSDDD